MRIVHGLHWSSGGIVNYLRNLLTHFDDPGLNHYVLILNSDQDTGSFTGSPCISCRSFDFDKKRFKGVMQFATHLKKLKPDIFHAHSFLPGVIGRTILPKGVTCVSTIHNEYPHYSPRNIREQLKLHIEYGSLRHRCRKVVCVSGAVKQMAESVMPNLPYQVITNGVDIYKLENPVGEDRGKNNHSFTILSLGRLHRQKGFDVLIEAFSRVLQKGINANLRIVGEGNLRPELERQIKNLGLQEKISLPGFTNQPLTEFMKADLFVCSSRFEGFSLATAEAMAFGLPVLITRMGGIVPHLKNGVDACIVPAEDPESLGEEICRLAKNPDLRRGLAVAGRGLAIREFDIERTVRSYQDLYLELLQ